MPMAVSRESERFNTENTDSADRRQHVQKIEQSHQICRALLSRLECPLIHCILATYIMAHGKLGL